LHKSAETFVTLLGSRKCEVLFNEYISLIAGLDLESAHIIYTPEMAHLIHISSIDAGWWGMFKEHDAKLPTGYFSPLLQNIVQSSVQQLQLTMKQLSAPKGESHVFCKAHDLS
jgi:hypothetical protein